MMILLTGCITTAEDAPQAFLADVVAEVQATMDDLTADELPPDMVVWIGAPDYRFEGASGFSDLMNETQMPPGGTFQID